MKSLRHILFAAITAIILLATVTSGPTSAKSVGGGGGSISSPDFGKTAISTTYYLEYQPLSERQMKLLTGAIRTVLVINLGVAVAETVVGEMIKATVPGGHSIVLGIGLVKTGVTAGVLTLMGHEEAAAKTLGKKGVGLVAAGVANKAAITGPWGGFVSIGFALDALVEEFK